MKNLKDLYVAWRLQSTFKLVIRLYDEGLDQYAELYVSLAGISKQINQILNLKGFK